MIFNVTVTLVFEAKNEEEAMEKAEATLNAIPNTNGLTWSEAHYADLNHE